MSDHAPGYFVYKLIVADCVAPCAGHFVSDPDGCHSAYLAQNPSIPAVEPRSLILEHFIERGSEGGQVISSLQKPESEAY
jgi:hypothetical protein